MRGREPPGLILGTHLRTGKDVVLTGTQLLAHKFVMGVTGSGKSRFLASLVVQLIRLGVSVLLLDPHSDLCDDILAFLLETGFYTNPAAYHRVLYVPFKGSQGRYIPFNVLKQQDLSPHDTARFVWEAFTRAWSELEGGSAPQMQQVILSGTLALCEAGLPVTRLNDLLTDAAFRAQVLTHVHDRQVVAFFARFGSSGQRAGLLSESALRRAFLLSFTPTLSGTLGQLENCLDLRALMDAGTSVLCDLGGLDADTQRMLGCLVTVAAETAALSRADVPVSARRPAALVLDEWSMFAAQSEVAMERLLALVRKFNVSILLACQTLGQTRKLQSSLQNTLPILFQVGSLDADWAAARVGTYEAEQVKTTPRGAPSYVSRAEQQAAWADRLQALPARHALTRLGHETVPFYTLGLSEPHCTTAQLRALKDHYARLLLAHPPVLGPHIGLRPEERKQSRQVPVEADEAEKRGPEARRLRRQVPLPREEE